MITVWSEIFNARDFMLVSLEGFKAFEFLFLVDFPKLDVHVTRTTGKHITTWMEIDIVDHTRVFSKSLLAFTSFIIPQFNGGVLT